jgi:hypothetical protein
MNMIFNHSLRETPQCTIALFKRKEKRPLSLRTAVLSAVLAVKQSPLSTGILLKEEDRFVAQDAPRDDRMLSYFVAFSSDEAISTSGRAIASLGSARKDNFKILYRFNRVFIQNGDS